MDSDESNSQGCYLIYVNVNIIISKEGDQADMNPRINYYLISITEDRE